MSDRGLRGASGTGAVQAGSGQNDLPHPETGEKPGVPLSPPPSSPSDQAEYEDAMATADVVLRKLVRRATKVRSCAERVGAANASRKVKETDNAVHGMYCCVDSLVAELESPPITRWRQEQRAKETARGEQQAILQRKLAKAKALLVDAGWDSEQLEVELKSGSVCPSREKTR